MARYTANNQPTGETVKTGLNTELQNIETAIADTLSRKGDTPNAMEADLDMNSNDILNVASASLQSLSLAGKAVVPSELTVLDGLSEIRVETFGGGVNKTAAENSTALLAALNAANGQKVTFSTAGTYNINKVEYTGSEAHIKIGSGVTVKGVGSEADYIFSLTVTSGSITGSGTIDANNLYANPVYFYNAGTASGWLVYKDVTIQNCFQDTALTLRQAVGIRAEGGFYGTYGENVHIRNVRSNGPNTEAGGAIARGIVAGYLNDGNLRAMPKKNIYINCKIENLTPASEADGIFAQETAFSYEEDNSLTVIGCEFINCEKRAVKSQVSQTICIGNTIRRTREQDITRAVDPNDSFGTEFDAQYGGGFFVNNTAYYDSGLFAPRAFATISTKRTLIDGAIPADSTGKFARGGYIAGNSVYCADDLTRLNTAFLVTQNRVSEDESFFNNHGRISIEGNDCDWKVKIAVFNFTIGMQNATDVQFPYLGVFNNRFRSLDAMFWNDRATDTPAGWTEYNGNFIVQGNTVVEKPLLRLESTDSEANTYSIDVQSTKATKVVGTISDVVTGEALNTDVVEFDIIHPSNQTIQLVAQYNRRSSSFDQVISRYEISFHESSLAGRRRIYERDVQNDGQSGEWEIVGDLGRSDTETGLFRTTIRKTAGVTTDIYGAQQGQYRIETKGADTCVIVAKDSSTGIAPTSTEIYTNSRLFVVNSLNSSYTLGPDDNGKIITLDNAGAITVTVPTGLPVGFACELVQVGAGQITVTASGTTLNSEGGLLSSAAQYAPISLQSYATDTFLVGGSLA